MLTAFTQAAAWTRVPNPRPQFQTTLFRMSAVMSVATVRASSVATRGLRITESANRVWCTLTRVALYLISMFSPETGAARMLHETVTSCALSVTSRLPS